MDTILNRLKGETSGNLPDAGLLETIVKASRRAVLSEVTLNFLHLTI